MDHLILNPDLLTVPLYIGGKPIEEVQEEYGLEDVIKLASNENVVGPSPMAVAAMQAAMQNLHRYPGIEDRRLRQKLARITGPGFDERNFLIGNGLCDVLRMISQGFLYGGGDALMASATFPMYRILTRLFGASPVFVPLKDYRHDLLAMADRITNRTRLLYVCSPNNPTGTINTEAECDALMARIPPHVLVIFDESYRGYEDDPAYPDTTRYVGQGLNAIVCRSFSKIPGLAGLRCGYAVARPDLIGYLEHAQLPFNTSSIALAGAAASLDDVEHTERSRRLVHDEKRYLYQAFTRLGLRFIPTQANFIQLVDLPADHKAICEALLRRGVIVRPMDGFGMPGTIRVTIGWHEENERLIEELGVVLAEMRELQTA